MPYQHLKWNAVEHPIRQQILMHTDWLLHDLYGIFRSKSEKDHGGGGSFTIALVLCCVMDGLATEIWPGKRAKGGLRGRIEKLFRERLPWQDAPKWVSRKTAADVVFLEVRNMLVHHGGKDEATKARPHGYGEPVATKWKPLPKGDQNIDKIESLKAWPSKWPVIWEDVAYGKSCYMISGVGLYWAVKQMTVQMIAEGGA